MKAIFTLFILSLFTLSWGLPVPVRRVKLSPATKHERRLLGSLGNLGFPTSVAVDLPEDIIFEPTGLIITIRPEPTATLNASSSTSSVLVPTSSSSAVTTSQASSTSAPQVSSTSSQPSSTSPSQPSSISTSQPSSTSTSSSSSLPISTNTPNTASGKLVVAHHMIGNTFPYTKADWAEDIELAHASGIDGFALNTGREEWEPARIADAYQAALESGKDFKLFLSIDMASSPCSTPDDAARIRKLVSAYASHPNQLKYNDKAFVSTFAGETCQFGQSSVLEGWKTQFANHPELDGKIVFVPSFFMDPAKFREFDGIMSGDFNWNSGWPIQVTTSFAKGLLNELTDVASAERTGPGSSFSPLQRALSKFIGAMDTDDEHLKALAPLQNSVAKRIGQTTKPIYMAAVSPWFFTHYGKDSFNKNFVFLSDQHLYAKRWESVIASRDKLDIVQILTWNDYGESHYIGPIKGAQPNSEAWTNGMPHTAWLDLTKYYATAFKSGTFPKIEKDKIFMWARPHPAQAQSSDPVPQPDNFELMDDAIWVVVMTTAPSTVVLSTSPTSSTSFEVDAGVTKLSVPITAGGTMRGTIRRNGQVVVDLSPTPEEFTFQGSPKSYNFNAFVASATAP